jgi:cytochrome c biogenesis protein CcmG/thiol:disulfide interchange protein DsbE
VRTGAVVAVLLSLGPAGVSPVAAAFAAPPAVRPAATPGPHAWMREGYIARFTGKPAPDFALRDLHGALHRLSALRGKVVLLNFWYSSCVPCRRETPDLIALHGRLGDRGLAILGINMDDVMMPQAAGRERDRFLAAFSIPYPVLVADQKVMGDYGEIPVQPISFLVDPAGRVARVFWGAFPGEVYERAIRPLLGQPAAAAPRPGR